MSLSTHVYYFQASIIKLACRGGLFIALASLLYQSLDLHYVICILVLLLLISYYYRDKNPICAMEYLSADEWILLDKQQQTHIAKLIQWQDVGYFIFLAWKNDTGMYRYCLAKDQVNAQVWQQLKARSHLQ